MASKFQKTRWVVLFLIAIAISILLLLLYFKTYLTVSEYTELLEDFNSEQLPLSTRFIIYTYQLWLVVPIAALVISFKLFNPVVTLKSSRFMMALLGLLMIGVFLLLLVVFGMYAPIYELNVK